MTEHPGRQEPPIPLQMHEVVQIAQRISRKWKEIAYLTKLFEDYEVENIISSRVGEDEISKALTMLTRYKERGGSRNLLADALNEVKLQSLSQKVLSGYFADGI